MARSTLSTNQMMIISKCNRREVQTLQEQGSLVPITKGCAGQNGSAEWGMAAILGASVAKVYVRDAGCHPSFFSDIAFVVSHMGRDEMLKAFSEGKTLLVVQPPSKSGGMDGYGALVAPKVTPTMTRAKRLMLQKMDVSKVYARVQAQITKMLDCDHPNRRAGDKYCGDCGAKLQMVPTKTM
jgi:hypothetical protein